MNLPVLRLGMAGFSPTEERLLLHTASGKQAAHWDCGALSGADAWLVNGPRVQPLGGGSLRIASGQPGGRSLQVQMADNSRPVAFATPLPATIEAKYKFELGSPEGLLKTLGAFEAWLAPVQAQFWFAELVAEHESTLGSGVFELRANSQLIGVLDMKGDAAVLCSATQRNFAAGTLKQIKRDSMKVPEHFCRTSVPNLMWQYASRTSRDLLPDRYRHGLIYFRRPPRIDQQLTDDEHLAVMRDLALRPSSFDELQMRTGIEEDALSRVLAALYYVGSITSNRRRAARNTAGAELMTGAGTTANALMSVHANMRPAQQPAQCEPEELTAPAPLRFA